MIISREDAIKSSKRISFENNNVIGSISLKGALIDDITFKKYNETLGEEKKVTYLNPEKQKRVILLKLDGQLAISRV